MHVIVEDLQTYMLKIADVILAERGLPERATVVPVAIDVLLGETTLENWSISIEARDDTDYATRGSEEVETSLKVLLQQLYIKTKQLPLGIFLSSTSFQPTLNER